MIFKYLTITETSSAQEVKLFYFSVLYRKSAAAELIFYNRVLCSGLLLFSNQTPFPVVWQSPWM